MLHVFTPGPFEILTPAIADGVTKYVELVRALDVSGSKTGTLLLRMYGGAPNLNVALNAHKIWPGESVEPLFQDKEDDPPIAFTEPALGVADNGKLLTYLTPSTLYSPALRILVALTASGADINAGTRITISGGIVLFAD